MTAKLEGLPLLRYLRDLYPSGCYHFCNSPGATSTGSISSQVLRVSRWDVPVQLNVTRFFMEVTVGTAAAADIARVVNDGVITSGSPTLTSATAAFVAGDVGKRVVNAKYPAGTVITAVTNGTTVTVSNNATSSGSSQTVTVGPAVLRIGVFSDNGSGAPSDVQFDSGVSGSASTSLADGFIDPTSATVQEVTCNLSLAPGTYFVGAVSQGIVTTQPTVRLCSPGAMRFGTASPTTLPVANTLAVGYTQTATTGPLSTFTASLSTTSTLPRIGFKVA